MSIKKPDSAIVLVKRGDYVEIGDKLFSTQKTADISLDIAQKLNIKPEHIFKHLHKLIGETVKKNELIADKPGMFGAKSVWSPADGTVKAIDHTNGQITLSVGESDTSNKINSQSVLSFFSGEITEIEDNVLKVTIKGDTQFPAREVSHDGGGEVFYFKDQSYYFTCTEHDLSGKIVCIEELRPHIQVKCEALGCIGFMYLKGKLSSELPTLVLSRVDDYQEIVSVKKKHVIFTMLDNGSLVYD